jgi:C-terminal binding-module, SLH-like, of glucodextranase
MDETSSRHTPWKAHLMLAVCVVAALLLVPLSFMLAGPFSAWLKSAGVHATPNFDDGRLIAELSDIERSSSDVPSSGAGDTRDIERALALRRFSVKKVAFRPGSGMGIAPRVNLCFEFDGELPNPHDSAKGFSLTVLHVYIAAPGTTARPPSSSRAANVDFAGPAWTHQVSIDGLHDQARVFDNHGQLIGRGLGLYVRPERTASKGPAGGAKASVVKTRVTAALPLALLGDPDRGEWAFYVLVGIADSTHPSLMRHESPEGRLEIFSGALTDAAQRDPAARPRLRPLLVKGRV